MKSAVIGGTGVYDPTWLRESHEATVDTPFGPVSLVEGTTPQGREMVFMNRHGAGHQVPPHRVNYRANLWALRKIGVEQVVATQAVGSLNLAMGPGSLVLSDQFMDFTKQRPTTFYDGGPGGVVHTDMTQPYCPHLRGVLTAAAKTVDLGTSLVNGGTYVCTEGPRFESPAEIRAYRLLGGDVVGMTGVPEVVLARELGLCYAAVALVTNYAAGISRDVLSHTEVLAVMSNYQTVLKALIVAAMDPLQALARDCSCRATAPHWDGGGINDVRN